MWTLSFAEWKMFWLARPLRKPLPAKISAYLASKKVRAKKRPKGSYPLCLLMPGLDKNTTSTRQRRQ